MSEFTVKQFAKPNGEFCGAVGGVFYPNDWASEIFGEELDYGRALAYLYRRFGYTIWGSDPYKEICEYILTTPMDGVALSVRIKTHVDFAYFIRKDFDRQCLAEEREPVSKWMGRFVDWVNQQGYDIVDFLQYDEQIDEAFTRWWDKNHPHTEDTDANNTELSALFRKENEDVWNKFIDLYKAIEPRPDADEIREGSVRWQIKQALCATMKDLLRPVQMRDVLINILGEFEPEGDEEDEETETYHNEAPRFHAAGNGVPDWYANKDLLWDFVDAVEKFGGGSAEAGMKKVVELINGYSSPMTG